jgi:TonB family protein
MSPSPTDNTFAPWLTWLIWQRPSMKWQLPLPDSTTSDFHCILYACIGNWGILTMNIRFAISLVICMASLSLAPAALSQIEVTQGTKPDDATSGKSAEPISRKNPTYPRIALNKDIEGWVLLSFIVEPDGKTNEIVVLDSSPPGVFEKASIKAIEGWIFRPAMIAGKPVRQSQTQIVMSFNIEDYSKGATRSFARKYKAAQSAISAGDLERANLLITELDDEGTTSQYENAYLELLKAKYSQQAGDNRQAIYHLKRTTIVEGEHIERPRRSRLLKTLFTLQVIENLNVQALQTYQVILDKAYTKDDDPIHETATQLKAFLEVGNPLAVKGMLSDYCQKCELTAPIWRHTLYHKTFYVDQIVGEISHIKLFCGYHWAVAEFDPELTWSTQDEWGSCDVYVFGTDGTTFRLVEL